MDPRRPFRPHWTFPSRPQVRISWSSCSIPDAPVCFFARRRLIGNGRLTTNIPDVAFYKTGLRNVYYSYKAARHLQRTYQKQFPDTPLHALPSYVLSRSDFLLLYRSRNDVKRIPIFALVLIVCGEFTPLIIPFISGIVPLTCRIPRQLESDRRKLEERRSRSFRDLVTSPPPPPPPTSTPSVLGSKETTNAVVDQDDNSNAINISNDGVEILPYLDRQQLLHISRSLGLHSTYWADRFFPSLLPPAVLLRSRIHRRQVYLETDDRLIVRDGGVDRMDLEEVKMALVDRGVDVLHRSDDQLRLILRNWLWLTTTKRWGLYTLFLTRSVLSSPPISPSFFFPFFG